MEITVVMVVSVSFGLYVFMLQHFYAIFKLVFFYV
jgi:hypothetical protein